MLRASQHWHPLSCQKATKKESCHWLRPRPWPGQSRLQSRQVLHQQHQQQQLQLSSAVIMRACPLHASALPFLIDPRCPTRSGERLRSWCLRQRGNFWQAVKSCRLAQQPPSQQVLSFTERCACAKSSLSVAMALMPASVEEHLPCVTFPCT